MSDDEYFLRDDLADLNDVDWGSLLDATTAAALRSTIQEHRTQPLPSQSQITHHQASTLLPVTHAQTHAQPQHHPTPSTSMGTSAASQYPRAQPHGQSQTNLFQEGLNQPLPPLQRQQPIRHGNQVAAQVLHIPSPGAIPHTEDVIPNLAVSPVSSNYFDDDDDNMDASFLAELDRIEQNALANSRNGTGNAMTAASATTHPDGQPLGQLNQPPAVALRTQNMSNHDRSANSSSATNSVPDRLRPQIPRTDSEYTLHGTQNEGNTQAPQTASQTGTSKRSHSEDPMPNFFTPRKKGKMKADDGELAQIIAGYEDELSCPICCDLFVAAHSANPCGHTFCGECEWEWQFSAQNPRRSCPICRQKLAKKMAMIPNITIDNIVEKHVNALAVTNKKDWAPGEAKHQEWMKRKQAWRDGAPMRSKKLKAPKKVAGPPTSLDPDIFGADIVDNEDEDSTYEGSDAELIPRPIQRARRSHPRAPSLRR